MHIDTNKGEIRMKESSSVLLSYNEIYKISNNSFQKNNVNNVDFFVIYEVK